MVSVSEREADLVNGTTTDVVYPSVRKERDAVDGLLGDRVPCDMLSDDVAKRLTDFVVVNW